MHLNPLFPRGRLPICVLLVGILSSMLNGRLAGQQLPDAFEQWLIGGSADVPAAAKRKRGKITTYAIDGWKNTVGELAAWRGTKKSAAAHGSRYFRVFGDHVVSKAEQVCSIDPKQRPRRIVCSGWLKSSDARDPAELRVEVRDADGGVLATRSSGAWRQKSWRRFRLILPVPKAAVDVRVELFGSRRSGKYCDAFFDGVRLEPIGEGHPVELADWTVKQLLAAYASARGEARHALELALAGRARDQRAVVAWAEDALADTKGWNGRQPILEMLAMAGDKAAGDVFEAELAGSNIRSVLPLLPLVSFDWQSILVKRVKGEKDAGLRRSVYQALATDGGKSSLRKLGGLYRRAEVADQIAILTALAPLPPTKTYKVFLAPQLKGKVDFRLRNRVMQTLSEHGDSRFFGAMDKYFGEMFGSYRAQWLEWCGQIDTPAALDALQEVVEQLQPADWPGFVDGVGVMRHPKVADRLRKSWLDAPDALLRRAALRQMRSAVRDGDAGRFARLSRDADREVAEEAVLALGATREARTVELLRGVIRRTVHPMVAARALRAWAEMASKGDGELVRATLKLVEDDDRFQVRVVALGVLATHAPIDGRDVMVEALGDSARQVRVAAADALTKVRERETVDLLIERLAEESGSSAHFIADCLAHLTGVNLGVEVAVWQSWWKEIRPDFKCPPPPKKRSRPKRIGTATSYYNIPIRSDAIVFLIDLSGSMSAEVKGGETRLEAAKRALIKVLESFDKNKRFTMIGFGTDLHPYGDTLVRATPKAIQDAVRWVAGLGLRGGTNIFDALEMALRVEGVESIFLLTDGSPSVGRITDMTEIRKTVQRENEILRIRIHTISIGSSGRGLQFLEQLAEENWGLSEKG